jgi:hypothetical protein
MANWQRIDEGNAKAIGVVRGVIVVLVVVVVAIPGYFDVVQPRIQGDAPAAAVRQLCADERQQDYVAVYALLSTSFIQQHQLTEAGFVQSQQGRDQKSGPVFACTIVGRDYWLSLWNMGAVFRVTVTLNDGSTPYTATGPIELVNDNGWKISSEGIDDVLSFAR